MPSVYKPENYAKRHKEGVQCYFFKTSKFVGKHKHVCREYNFHSGNEAAVKKLKTGSTFDSESFYDDIRCAQRALYYVAEFQRYIDSTAYANQVSIKVNVPEVCTQCNDEDGKDYNQNVLVEPFLNNFERFNSNSGAWNRNTQADVAQALSHFSYHASGGRELLCDLQGQKKGNSYVLSDVVINSTAKKYGMPDLGVTGIENFFSQHICTPFCNSRWRSWKNAQKQIPSIILTTLTSEVFTATARHYESLHAFPSDIHFAQDSISFCFRDGRTLLQTTLEVARHDPNRSTIPMLTVVRYEEKLWSLDNRRLAVFRLLQMCGKCSRIKVEIADFASKANEFHRKHDSQTNGNTVEIRQTEYQIGKNKSKTTFPLHEIKNCYANKHTMNDNQFEIFVAAFVDE